METSLHYGLADKHLAVKLRETLTAPLGAELKGGALLNSVTGQFGYTGCLRAGVKIGRDIKDAGSSPLLIKAGACVIAEDTKAVPQPQLQLFAKKTISLLEGPRTIVSAKAWGNVDPQTAKVIARKAVVKLSHKWLAFTKRQDLKLTAGLDMDWPMGLAEPKLVPFGQVRENNWAVNYRQNKWFVTYDL